MYVTGSRSPTGQDAAGPLTATCAVEFLYPGTGSFSLSGSLARLRRTGSRSGTSGAYGTPFRSRTS